MEWLDRLWNLLRRRRLEDELAEEMASHLKDAAEHGRSADEARQAFGNTLHYREQSRDLKLLPWLDSLFADAVFGWRQLRKRPVVSAAAILSLALASGATTAAFRLIDALLLRPLPVAHPERLYAIARQGYDPGGHDRVSEAFEYPLFQAMRRQTKAQAELIAASYTGRIDVTYGSDDDLERVSRQYVSGWMFDAFGLRPILGRLFTEDDDRVPQAKPYAVISYDYWSRRFARDPKIAGRSFRVFEKSFQIIGVAPRGFQGTEPGVAVDIFVPTMMNDWVTRDDSSWFRTFVLLKPGVRPESVRDRLAAIHQAAQVERAKGFKGMPESQMRNFLQQRLLLKPAASGISDIQKDYGRALAALAVLVALVLLIACANVANLMSAQAAARAREMSLRVAIGAGRGRLIQLVLIESVIVSVLAAALGGSFAWWAAPFVAGHINPPDRPLQLFMPADGRAALFGLGLTLLVICLFGAVPALRASAAQPVSALKGGSDPHFRRRLMYGLVAAQVAFCCVVLLVGGLFVTTLERLTRQSTGFSSERILTVDAVAPRARQTGVWEQTAESLRTTPGVERVAYSMFPLLSGDTWNGWILFHGTPVNDQLAYFLGVSPGWLDTMRIPLLAGRDFRAGDTFPGVAIINETFARMYFPDANPLGKWFEKGDARLQVIGVAADARYHDMREPITPTAYVPFTRLNADGSMHPQGSAAFLIRTAAANPMALATSLRRAIRKAQPALLVVDARAQQEFVDQHTIRERLLAMLALFFGAVAMLLAGVGLYGVLDYSVVQRRKEISIRMAIGAPAGRIARSVTGRIYAMVAMGAAVGLALGMGLEHFIASLLYRVKATDGSALAWPAALIVSVALVAALPAIVRAVRIDPARTLREE